MAKIFRVIVALVCVLVGMSTLSAESAANHAPHLTIATSSGQNTFHIGERIPLRLCFTGPDDKTFAIDLARYDRSGRMNEDTFSLDPQSGWVDPLRAYFAYGAYMGGGLRGGQYLSSKAVTIDANLNEWVRFDEPGVYTLTVTSHRVGPSGKRQGEFPERTFDLLSSNRLTLIITPATRQWQDERLRRIVRNLPRSRKSGAEPGELSVAQKSAVEDLRFFGTPKALPALTAQLRDGDASKWEAYFGLIGLPQEVREQALLSMRSLLEVPNFPVSRMFLEAMSWLHMPEEVGSDARAQITRQDFDAFVQRRIAARDLEWQNLVLSLHHKKGPALQATETALMETQPAHPNSNVVAILGGITRASFATMSPADQTRALEEHWDLIGSRELLPQIRAIAKAPPVPTDNMNPFFSPRARIAVALRRWYELEPEGATAEAINQIAKAYPQLYAKEVSYLPDEGFPQFETLWAETLANGEDINDYQPAASLLLRFGTGAASAQMVAILRNPKDQLGNRLEPALAYLLKFEPGAAQSVLQQRPDLLFGHMDSIAKQTSPSAFLTAAALDKLTSPDPTEVADALSYLRHFGDEHVRELIYQAFLAWYAQNKALSGKDPNELPSEREAQLNLGEDFVAALLGNQGWLPSRQLREDVLLHRIASNTRDRFEITPGADLNVTIFEGDFPSYEVGPFDAANLKLFEAKLDQFPAGTKFTLQHVTCPDQHSQDLLEAGLPALFLKHGMDLVTPDESGSSVQ